MRHEDAFFGRDFVYVFHQFTSDYPAAFPLDQMEIRKRLDELERERARL